MKTCTKCGKTKKLVEYRTLSCINGNPIHYWCKTCEDEYNNRMK